MTVAICAISQCNLSIVNPENETGANLKSLVLTRFVRNMPSLHDCLTYMNTTNDNLSLLPDLLMPKGALLRSLYYAVFVEKRYQLYVRPIIRIKINSLQRVDVMDPIQEVAVEAWHVQYAQSNLAGYKVGLKNKTKIAMSH